MYDGLFRGERSTGCTGTLVPLFKEKYSTLTDSCTSLPQYILDDLNEDEFSFGFILVFESHHALWIWGHPYQENSKRNVKVKGQNNCVRAYDAHHILQRDYQEHCEQLHEYLVVKLHNIRLWQRVRATKKIIRTPLPSITDTRLYVGLHGIFFLLPPCPTFWYSVPNCKWLQFLKSNTWGRPFF